MLKNLRKEKREKLKRERRERLQEEQSHLTSYINRDQFFYFKDELAEIFQKISEHSILVDDIEAKLIRINSKRQRRKLNGIETEDLSGSIAAQKDNANMDFNSITEESSSDEESVSETVKSSSEKDDEDDDEEEEDKIKELSASDSENSSSSIDNKESKNEFSDDQND